VAYVTVPDFGAPATNVGPEYTPPGAAVESPAAKSGSPPYLVLGAVVLAAFFMLRPRRK